MLSSLKSTSFWSQTGPTAQTLAYHAKKKISQFSFQSSLDCISAKAELFKLCVDKSLIAMLIYVSGLGMLSEVWMDNGLAKRRQ